MAKDLTNLFNQIVNGPEFTSFQDRVGGVVNSGPTQVKRCTIQLEDIPGKHRWLFFSNGYVREQNFVVYYRGSSGEWAAKVLSKPPTDWIVTYDTMITLIDKANTRINKREKTSQNRVNKLYKKAHTAIEALFDPQNYELYCETSDYVKDFHGFLLDGNIQIIMERMYSRINPSSKDSFIIRKNKLAEKYIFTTFP